MADICKLNINGVVYDIKDSVVREIVKILQNEGHLKSTDIIDSLESTNSTVPLSANQGRQLNINKIDNISINENTLIFYANGVNKGSVVLPIQENNEGLTSEQITQLLTAYTHSQSAHFSGNYNDLTNKPTIPSEYTLPTASATQLGGVKVGAGLSINNGMLSANGGGTADSVDWSNVQNRPTALSQFTNDSRFITSIPSEYITETELNAKGYLTEHQDISSKVDKVNGKGLSTNDLTNTLKSNYDTAYTHSQSAHFSGNYNDLTNKPTKLSQFTNDSGFISSIPSEYITETELNAKGYATEDYVTETVNNASMSGGYTHPTTHPASMITGLSTVATSGNYNDLTNKPTIPSKTSQLTNDSGYLTKHQSLDGLATKSYVDTSVANIVNSAPETLDTLNELATALGNDPNFATTVSNQIGNKVDKVNGKGLSTNDLTNTLKSNYDTAYTHSQSTHAPSNAEPNVQADWNVTDINSDAYIANKPTNVSAFTNDVKYASETFVINKIEASLSGGEVDLSGYVTKERGNANQITFTDGQTFQAKLDAGTLKGDKGDKGEQGERGLQGEKGDIGATGAKGDKGEQGIQGERGATGAKGQDGLTTAISVNGTTYTHVNGTITLPNYPTVVSTANGITIADTAGNFTATNVEGALAELFQYVSDGKTLLASAITDMGVTTLATATFEQIANNIRKITTSSDTPKIVLNKISNMTVNKGQTFNILYSSNIHAIKHEISWDGGSTFYDKTSEIVVSNTVNYKYSHNAETAYDSFNMAIRVTDRNGNTDTKYFTITFENNFTFTRYKRLNEGVLVDYTDTSQATYYSTVNFNEVTAGASYTITINSCNYICVCYYDESQSYVSYTEVNTDDWSVKGFTTTITIPSNIKYIRVCVTNDGTQVVGTLTESLLDSTGAYVIDDFLGSSVDSNKWSYELGYVRNGELQNYTSTNTEVSNSILALKGIKDNNGNWTSSSIISKGHFAFMYGKIECRAKIDPTLGSFSAFWTLGDSFELSYHDGASPDTLGEWWAYCGEFDVMEFYSGNLTCGIFFNEKEESGRVWYNNYDFNAWHTFAMEWLEDGTLIFSIDGNEVSRTSATNNRAFHIPHFILLNQAIGASGGTPADSTTAITQYVDWVKYYPASTSNLVLNSSDFSLQVTDTNDSAHNCMVRPIFNDNCINKSLTWSSSDSSLVWVHSGLCSTYDGANGSVTITATSHSGVSKSITLTVTNGTIR